MLTVQSNNCRTIHPNFILLFLVFLLSGCGVDFSYDSKNKLNIEIADSGIVTDNFNRESFKNLQFNKFDNSGFVDFFDDGSSTVFKISPRSIEDENLTIMVMPHYFTEVSYFDSKFNKRDTFKRNHANDDRKYSTNIIAFDIEDNNKVLYILIKNNPSRKIEFVIDNKVSIEKYDQKLIFIFTTIYAIIFTLIFVNLIFYVFIKNTSYFYYSIYTLSALFSVFYQDGIVSYFPVLTTPIFGAYTPLVWLKLPAVILWFFVIKFLDLNKKSGLDFKLAKIMLWLEIISILIIIFLSLANIYTIYPKISSIINSITLIGSLIAIYVPVSQALKGNKQALFLAIGWTVYMVTVIMRVYYTIDLNPQSFWLPRAYEFGLLFDSLIISFGLAYKTTRVYKQRDAAELNLQRVDRELFCKELDKSFQNRSHNTIEKHFGEQRDLSKIIDSYFVSSINQLVEVTDVFYISQKNNTHELSHLSGKIDDFNLKEYVTEYRGTLAKICSKKKAKLQDYTTKEGARYHFIIVPVNNESVNDLCLFLSVSRYEEVNDENLITIDLFTKALTRSLMGVRNFQNTVQASRFDSLTSVLNRKSIEEKLLEAISSTKGMKQSISIAFIDIDNFKLINDNHGHKVGDDILVFLCDQLLKEFYKNAFVGRFGGDEFVVVFKQHSRDQIVVKLSALYQYLSVNCIHGINVQISTGVAIQSGDINDKKLLMAADTALYKAKNNGKNQFVID